MFPFESYYSLNYCMVYSEAILPLWDIPQVYAKLILFIPKRTKLHKFEYHPIEHLINV